MIWILKWFYICTCNLCFQTGRDAYRTPMQWDSVANAGFCADGATPWLPVNAGYSHENVAVSIVESWKVVILL